MTLHARSMAAAALALMLAATAAAAQNLFAPVARVNDRVVTQYELNQRVRFYEVLRAPGNLPEESLRLLINERLQLDAARELGITLTPEQLLAGKAEFAARANLTVEEFERALAAEGVAPETFTEFVRIGLLWREVVGQRFGPRVQVTEAEIDRAIALASGRSGVRVLLSEIILPANTPAVQEQSRRRAAQIAEIDSLPAFASAARRFSVSPTRGRGGRIEWLPLANLPPQIAQQVLTLRPGEVTDPIPIPNAIALFQLRALEETAVPDAEVVAVEYARFLIPGGRTAEALAEAGRIRGRVDTCDDLYGVARGLPANRLTRDSLPPAQVPRDIALELAKLDEGEVSTALTTADGRGLVFLMLCGRTLALAETLSREEVRASLRNQRLASFADGYLAQLRSDAVIVRP